MKLTLTKLLAVGLASSMCLAACGTEGSGNSGSGEEAVLIGGIHPMTGAASYYGAAMNAGAQLAVDEVNDRGGLTVGDSRVKLKYQPEDSKSDPSTGVAAFRKLEADGADFIVGPLSGSVAAALTPIVAKSDVVLVIDGAADPNPALLDPPNVFRATSSYNEIDEGVVAFFGDSEYERVAILNDQVNPSFSTSVDGLVSGLEGVGSEVVATHTFSTGDSDFNPQLTAMLSSEHPDALLIRGYPLESAQAVEQARGLGYEGAVIWEVVAPPATIKAAVPPQTLEGVINIIPAYPKYLENLGHERMTRFADSYRENFAGENPGELSAYVYDTVTAIAAAIEAAGETDPKKVAEALGQLNVNDLELVNGYEPQKNGALFDETGQAIGAMERMVWQNDSWTRLESEQ